MNQKAFQERAWELRKTQIGYGYKPSWVYFRLKEEEKNITMENLEYLAILLGYKQSWASYQYDLIQEEAKRINEEIKQVQKAKQNPSIILKKDVVVMGTTYSYAAYLVDKPDEPLMTDITIDNEGKARWNCYDIGVFDSYTDLVMHYISLSKTDILQEYI